jgi:hypothetical protein
MKNAKYQKEQHKPNQPIQKNTEEIWIDIHYVKSLGKFCSL